MISAQQPWFWFGLPTLVGLALGAAGCDAKSSSQKASGSASGSALVTPQPIPAAPLVPAVVPPVTQPIVVPAAHPDTISHASEYAGSAAPVATTESFDGAAARTRIRVRLSADQSPVQLLVGTSALELGQRVCEQVVPQGASATPVLLKPNLGGFDWFRDSKSNHGDNGVTGRTTDPEFVRGVIRCLKQRGYKKITVSDGFTGKASDWNRLIKVSGYEAMTAAEGVPLVAMDDDGVFDVVGEKPGKPVAITGMEKTSVPTLLMPRLLAWHLQHGLYISLPKIKTHRYAVFSIGIKAQQGTVFYSDAAPAFHQRGRSHREIGKALKLVKANAPDARAVYVTSLEKFAQRMADVLEVEAPDIVLAEGAPAMSGDGFGKLFPSAELVAIGGSNVVAVDRIGAELLGLWNNAALANELGGHATSPLLEVAAKQLGIDITAPNVTGDGAYLLGKPRPFHLIGMANFIVRGDGASAGAVVRVVEPALGTVTALPMSAMQLHAKTIAPADAPRIDGADDKAWDQAVVLPWSTNWQGSPVGINTIVRALWHASQGATPATLYLRWELDDASLAASGTDQSRAIDQERIDLYVEDCVELFLAPDAKQPAKYFEIEVGPYGHYFDLAIDRSAPTAAQRSDATWSGGLRIGTSRDVGNHRAVIEVAITAPEIARVLRTGATLPIGLYRMEGKKPRHYLAAFPTNTPKPNFHVPSAFGMLVLE